MPSFNRTSGVKARLTSAYHIAVGTQLRREVKQWLNTRITPLPMQKPALAGRPNELFSHILFAESLDHTSGPLNGGPVPRESGQFVSAIQQRLADRLRLEAEIETATAKVAKSKFKWKRGSVISMALSAVATVAVGPFVGGLLLPMSASLFTGLGLSFGLFTAGFLGMGWLKNRVGGSRNAKKELKAKNHEYEMTGKDILNMYADPAQRKALASVLFFMIAAGERTKYEKIMTLFSADQKVELFGLQKDGLKTNILAQLAGGRIEEARASLNMLSASQKNDIFELIKENLADILYGIESGKRPLNDPNGQAVNPPDIYRLFTNEQNQTLSEIMDGIKVKEAFEQAREQNQPIEDALKEEAAVVLTRLRQRTPHLGIVRDLERLQTHVLNMPKATERPTGEEINKVQEILGKKKHDYQETEEGLSKAAEDRRFLDKIKRKYEAITDKQDLEKTIAQQLDRQMTNLSTIVEDLKAALDLKLLKGEHSAYEIMESIGSGGMGDVWKARNSSTDEPVAVKYLALKKLVEDNLAAAKGDIAKAKRDVMAFILRFHNEYRVGERLKDHENITEAKDTNIRQIIDVRRLTSFFKGGTPEAEKELILDMIDLDKIAQERVFLVTEFIPRGPKSSEPGPNLKEFYRGRMTVEDIHNLLVPVLEALAFAHDQDITHRDLKPSNLIVTNNGSKDLVKIIDFGIAKIVLEEATQLTTLDQLPGSANYLPPFAYYRSAKGDKQAKGELTKYKQVDIYQMGIIMYEMLTGRNPFLHLTSKEEYMQFLANPKAFDHRLIPEEIRPIVQKMLSIDPRDNFQSMHEVVAAFKAARSRPAAEEPAESDLLVDIDVDPKAVQSAIAEAEAERRTKMAKPAAPEGEVDVSEKTSISRKTVIPDFEGEQDSLFLQGDVNQVREDIDAVLELEAKFDYDDLAMREEIGRKIAAAVIVDHPKLAGLGAGAVEFLANLPKYKNKVKS